MRPVVLSWLCLVFLTGCAGVHKKPGNQIARLPGPPEPYVRISSTDSNRIDLQIAAREFAPTSRGQPMVWLTGVSHIGDTNYYAALQRHLDAQTLVLFEGVGAGEGGAAGTPTPQSSKPRPQSAVENRGSLQSAMANSLGLVFQLEAIDYNRTNFLNSDLTISQLRKLMVQSEKNSDASGAGESFENLVQMMDGSSWFDALLQMALRLLGANPKFQALGRLALIDLLGAIQGDPARLQGLPPDMKQLLEVLLQRRNEKVVSDLISNLKDVGKDGSISVFFGTGHMPDLEMRLRRELGYRPVHETWFTAFGVDLAQVSQSERELVDKFVNWQLKEAGAYKGPGN